VSDWSNHCFYVVRIMAEDGRFPQRLREMPVGSEVGYGPATPHDRARRSGTSTPRITIPDYLQPSWIGGVPLADALAAAIRSWHDVVHATVGGSMQSLTFAAAAPIFWAFHGEIDGMYTAWRRTRGLP